jgi:hypothetical protein
MEDLDIMNFISILYMFGVILNVVVNSLPDAVDVIVDSLPDAVDVVVEPIDLMSPAGRVPYSVSYSSINLMKPTERVLYSVPYGEPCLPFLNNYILAATAIFVVVVLILE